MVGNYEIVALISGILGMYARYNFIQVFRENKQENSKFEIMAFGLFYLVSNAVYFIFDIPIVNLMVQIFFLASIGLLMGFKLKKALLATSIIIVIIVAIESVVVFLTGYVSGSAFIEAEYQSVIGIVAVNMTTLLASKVFNNYKNVRKNNGLPMNYWIAVFVFPIMSLLLLIVIFGFSSENKTIVIASTMMILTMNFITFWLYDRLIWQYEKKLDEVVMEHMNISYKKQLEIMRASILNTKSFQHDIKRHVISIDTLLKEDRNDDLRDYINEMKANIENSNTVSNTGNVIIDSIINFEVNHSGVNLDDISLKAVDIPIKIAIRDYDLTIVLSNIVSNALTAIKKVENGKAEIYFNYKKGVLLIWVENDFYGELIVENDKMCTTYEDKENHGYGIENVKRAIKKYDGKLNMEYINNKFKADIVMYEKT